jgi:hypothetical protein
MRSIRARKDSVEMGGLDVGKLHSACPILGPSHIKVKNEKERLLLASTTA